MPAPGRCGDAARRPGAPPRARTAGRSGSHADSTTWHRQTDPAKATPDWPSVVTSFAVDRASLGRYSVPGSLLAGFSATEGTNPRPPYLLITEGASPSAEEYDVPETTT